MPGQKLLGRSPVGGLQRANVHCTTVTAMEKRAIALLLWAESRYRVRFVELSRSGISGKSVELRRWLIYGGRGWPTWR